MKSSSSRAKPSESRHHQIEEISRGTKVLARQLGITVMLLSQLNREVEKRTTGRAVLSDLKESGAIEEDADVVILLNKHSESVACLSMTTAAKTAAVWSVQ